MFNFHHLQHVHMTAFEEGFKTAEAVRTESDYNEGHHDGWGEGFDSGYKQAEDSHIAQAAAAMSDYYARAGHTHQRQKEDYAKPAPDAVTYDGVPHYSLPAVTPQPVYPIGMEQPLMHFEQNDEMPDVAEDALRGCTGYDPFRGTA